MILLNLVSQNLVGKGTWVGVQTNEHKILRRLVVERITAQGQITALDVNTNQKFTFAHTCVVEIEGMSLPRFLQQADLDSNGIKITNIIRRGRKPKLRS